MSNADLIAEAEAVLARGFYVPNRGVVDDHALIRRLAAALAAQEEEIGRLLGTRRWNVEETAGGLRVCVGDHHRSTDCEWIEYVPASEIARLTSELKERDAMCERAMIALKPFAEAVVDPLFTVDADDLEIGLRKGAQRYPDREGIYFTLNPGEDHEEQSEDYMLLLADLRRASAVHAELSTLGKATDDT